MACSTFALTRVPPAARVDRFDGAVAAGAALAYVGGGDSK
jgi:hypothetical protein